MLGPIGWLSITSKVVRIAILLLESYDSTNPRQPVDPNRIVDPTRRDLGQKNNLQFFLEARLCWYFVLEQNLLILISENETINKQGACKILYQCGNASTNIYIMTWAILSLIMISYFSSIENFFKDLSFLRIISTFF